MFLQTNLPLFAVFSITIFEPCVYSKKLCSNLPSGLDRLRHGVDITKLDWLPFDASIDNGFRTPILEFTCDQGKVKEINGDQYEIPDQVSTIDKIPSGWLFPEANTYISIEDFQKIMAEKANVELLPGFFSSSGSVIHIQDLISNSSRYIEDVSVYSSALAVYLDQNSNIDNYVNSYLKEELNENSYFKYEDFIRKFGTHVTTNGKLGGVIRLTVATEQSYYNLQNTNEVKKIAESFLFNVLNGGVSVDNQTNFTSSSIISLRYYGGNINILEAGIDIRKWQATLGDNLWLIGGNLTPIYNLINNGTIRKSIKRAVQIHSDRAYLEELQRLVYSFNVPKYLQKKVSDFKKIFHQFQRISSLLNHEKLNHFVSEVKAEFETPAWFKKNVKLCFRWKGGLECGDTSENRQICAVPGGMPSHYKDNSQIRGCYMGWGLMKSTPTPSWFDEVKICFKWVGEKSARSIRCGQGYLPPYCAKVGEYTLPYHDDTKKGYYGCKMQWMLSVPTNAQLWLLKTKLCIEWYPNGKHLYCNEGIGKSLCAFANEYTEPYLDKTQSGKSCNMRWGIKM